MPFLFAPMGHGRSSTDGHEGIDMASTMLRPYISMSDRERRPDPSIIKVSESLALVAFFVAWFLDTSKAPRRYTL